MNLFFDVDSTIMSHWEGKLRPGVREIFTALRADGHTLYIWSGLGLRWREIDRHDLRGLIATCYTKPLWDHHEQLPKLGVEVLPDLAVDDHQEIIEAFGGILVEPFYYYDPRDREMERVYREITRLGGAPAS